MSHDGPTPYGHRGTHWGNRPVVGDTAKHVALDATDPRVIGIAKAGRALCNLCEHALQVYRRARDHPQDLGGRDLLLSRLREVTHGLGEYFGQLLDSAFRRGIIVDGRSCHDYTPFPAACPSPFTVLWGAG